MHFKLDIITFVGGTNVWTTKLECSYGVFMLSHLHFTADVWNEVIQGLVYGNVIEKFGCYHREVFDLRHKVLIVL